MVANGEAKRVNLAGRDWPKLEAELFNYDSEVFYLCLEQVNPGIKLGIWLTRDQVKQLHELLGEVLPDEVGELG